MALVIEVEFLLDVFAASDGNNKTSPAEWPPAPARLYAALIAACEADDSEALRWLETLGDPVIHATDEVRTTAPQSPWLVTNRLQPNGGSADHPGRKNVQYPRCRTWLKAPTVRYVWEEAAPPEGMVDRLDRIARQVSYLGRPVSPVLVTVTTSPAEKDFEPGEGLAQYETGSTIRTAVLEPARELRTIYPGLFDSLDDAFINGSGGGDPQRRSTYRLRLVPETKERVEPLGVVPSPWPHFVVFELDPGTWMPAQRAVQVASALRDAVLSRLGDDAHPVISGHGVHAPHVAFVPLPAVGHPSSDGHLLGVALGIPDNQDVVTQLQGAFTQADNELSISLDNVRGYPPITLTRRAGGSRWGRNFDHFRATSDRWWTVTPAVLDLIPTKRVSEEDAVLASITRAGYPAPEEFRTEMAPIQAGEPSFRMKHTLRHPGDRRRQFRYIEMRFPVPVRGPVVIGAHRHFGLGLCRVGPEGRYGS